MTNYNCCLKHEILRHLVASTLLVKYCLAERMHDLSKVSNLPSFLISFLLNEQSMLS